MDNFDLRKYLAENRLFNFRPKLPITDYVDIDQEELNQLYDRLKDEFEGNVGEFIEEYGQDFLSPNIEKISKYYGAKVLERDIRDDFFLADGLEFISSNERFEKWLDRNKEFYLGEGKLLKENENYDAAWIASHSDYYDIYIGTKKSFYEDQEEGEDASFGSEAEDYLIDLDPGKYQMIYWDDDGPNSMSFNTKEEFVKESIYNYWGESNFIEQFPGLEDELDPLYDEDNPDVYWNAFEEHMKDNLDKYYEIIKDMINNSYPDGDSASGVVLLVDGKEVAGADNGRLTNFY